MAVIIDILPKKENKHLDFKMSKTVHSENKMDVLPVRPLLLSMAWPMILAMLVGACYNIVDSLFVSHYSENALTAVSLAYPIQNLIVAIGTGVGVGANALLATYLGKKDSASADKTALHSILIGFGFYLILLLFGLFAVRKYFLIQTSDPEIVEMGTQYLRIVAIFSFGQIFELICEKLLQATGRTVYTMLTQAAGAVLNIILDPILIFGLLGLPEMGTKGAAVATVAGQIFAMLLGVYFNLFKNKEIHWSLRGFHVERAYLSQICRLGIPTIIMNAMTAVMSFGINKILLSYSSTAAAVFGAYFKIQTFVYMALFGLNNALLSIVAFNRGAGKKDRVDQAIFLAGMYSAGIGAIGTLIMFFFAKQLLSAFNPSETMLSIGMTAFRILSLTFVFGGLSTMVSYALQGFTRGVSSMFISALRQVILLLPLALLFSRWMGLEGVWIGYLAAEVLTTIAALLYLRKVKRIEGC